MHFTINKNCIAPICFNNAKSKPCTIIYFIFPPFNTSDFLTAITFVNPAGYVANPELDRAATIIKPEYAHSLMISCSNLLSLKYVLPKLRLIISTALFYTIPVPKANSLLHPSHMNPK